MEIITGNYVPLRTNRRSGSVLIGGIGTSESRMLYFRSRSVYKDMDSLNTSQPPPSCRMVTSETSSSPSLPKLSAAGSAYLTGLAILANPRRIPASNTFVFDTQLYLGPTPQDMLIGSLRYFNSANSIFEDGPDLYYINTSVSTFLSIFSSINSFLVCSTRIHCRCASFWQPSAFRLLFHR